MTRNTLGDKKAVRAAVRAAGDGEVRAAGGSGAIEAIEAIEALPEFAAARTVALYHALSGEVPTAAMLARWHGTKRLALPAVLSGGEMVFREYTGDGNLATGAYGIAEPLAGPEIPPHEIDLMLVPGVAFDGEGRRLGRGGGFYDRYLGQPDAAPIHKVGLCRPEALVNEVPTEPHDVAMDKIIFGD